MVNPLRYLIGPGSALLLGIVGCSTQPAHEFTAAVDTTDPARAMGEWVIADRSATFGQGLENAQLTESTIRITETGFDRFTTVTRDDRLIEVGETGTWLPTDRGIDLSPAEVTIIVTQPGDVSIETFEPEIEDGAAARLTLVGDRLVLEMLEAGRTVGRIAYRRGP